MDAPHIRPNPTAVAPPPRPAREANPQLGQRVRSLRLSHIPNRRITAGSIIGWGVLLALVGGGGFWGYRWWQTQQTTKSAPQAAAQAPNQPANASPNPIPSGESPRSQPIAAPAKGDVALESKGYIVPAHQILVSPKVSGMIVKLNVEEGKRIEKGEILAVLESTDYQADFNRAKAAVALAQAHYAEMQNGTRPEEIKQAKAELQESEAQLGQLTAEWKRSTELRKSGSITQQEFEISESQYKAMVQRVERLNFRLQLLNLGERDERREVAKAEIAQAEADLLKAEWRLGNCTIRAPLSGTILKKNAEEGNIVNPIAFNGSFSLCEMADLSDLEVDLNIQERDVSLVKVGQRCRIRAEAWPDRVYDGHVSRLMPIADRAKGAVPVRVKLSIPAEEEGQYLKPEMGAIVTFLNEQLVETTSTVAAP